MMVPLLAPADPFASVPVVPFCGVLDVVRLLLRTGNSSAEVCEVCQTINLDSVHFCKCCDAKMPAYYAALSTGATESTATRLQDAHRIAGQAYAYALAGVGLVILLAALYVAISHAQALSPPARAWTGQPPPVLTSEPVKSNESRMAFIAPASAAEPAADTANVTAPEDVTEPAAPAAMKPRPARRTVPTRALKPAASRLAAAEASVARCEAMSFPLARAVCMNNRCAQPALVRSTVCVDAVRQRRIDEARRNPTLLG